MEIPKPNFHSLLVIKENGQIKFRSLQNHETRNESTTRLIHLADQLYNFPDFDCFMVNTDDKPMGNEFYGLKLFSYSTSTNDFSHTCPDFLFDNWTQVQIGDYESTIRRMSELGDELPNNHLLGWRGAVTHPNRAKMGMFNDKSKYDVEFITGDRTDPNKLTCPNYVSLFDHVRKWRYLIDVEGSGWSARTKLFFFSKRVLFLQDRPFKEWYYEKLEPWVHYIPINRDLSDLDEKLDRLRTESGLEDFIRMNAFEFAKNNLRRINAIERWGELIGAAL